MSCFVAGTLVHTKDGLKPIEQIKVGDYVLSKPESGEGDASYKRVVKLFENEDQEVWYVSYTILNEPAKTEFVVVTGNHPFWVKDVSNSAAIGTPEEIYKAPNIRNAWLRTVDLYRHNQDMCKVVFELADGREAIVSRIGPVLASEWPDIGVVYSLESVGDGNEGFGIDFSNNCAAYLRKPNGRLSDVFAVYDDRQPFDQLGPVAIANITDGYVPLLRKVYNLEVEENHTYYVGALGVLVHNTCKIEIQPVHKS